jgi:hypothetical protein
MKGVTLMHHRSHNVSVAGGLATLVAGAPPADAQPGTIFTVASSGHGFSGDGGHRLRATLQTPDGRRSDTLARAFTIVRVGRNRGAR